MKNAEAKCMTEAKYFGINGEKTMINVKFSGKKFNVLKIVRNPINLLDMSVFDAEYANMI